MIYFVQIFSKLEKHKQIVELLPTDKDFFYSAIQEEYRQLEAVKFASAGAADSKARASVGEVRNKLMVSTTYIRVAFVL
jgi:hypothetical protein